MLDMRPSFAEFDEADSPLRHAVIKGDGSLAPRVRSNGDYLGLGQFSGCVRGPLQLNTTSLGVTIGNIVGHGPDKEMIRIATERHVATMADAQAGRDVPVGQFPRVTVGTSWNPVDVKRAISGSELSCGPQPAVARLVNLRPESFLYTLRSHMTSIGRVVRGACERDTRSRLAYFTAISLS